MDFVWEFLWILKGCYSIIWNFTFFCFAGAEIEQRTTASIGAARQKIGKEISELNEKLKVCKDAIQQMKAEIAKLEQQEIEGPEQSTAPAVVQWERKKVLSSADVLDVWMKEVK